MLTTTPGEPLFFSQQHVLLCWGGLRGALSLRLVLAVPLNLPSRELLVVSTYAVVLFTLLVQGLSMRLVVQRMRHPSETIPIPESADRRGER
ncbi:MAG TPA: cation:proton antiporter [Ktedonobacteraceae bacterium]